MNDCSINQSKFDENYFNLSGVFVLFIHFSSELNSKIWPDYLKGLKREERRSYANG